MSDIKKNKTLSDRLDKRIRIGLSILIITWATATFGSRFFTAIEPSILPPEQIVNELAVNSFHKDIFLTVQGEALIDEKISVTYFGDKPNSDLYFVRKLATKMPSIVGELHLEASNILVSRFLGEGRESEEAFTTELIDQDLLIAPTAKTPFQPGTESYHVTYTVGGAVINFMQNSIFQHNLLGTFFNCEVNKLTGNITLPKNVSADSLKVQSLVFATTEVDAQVKVASFFASQLPAEQTNFLTVFTPQQSDPTQNNFVSFAAPRPIKPGEVVLIRAEYANRLIENPAATANAF